MSRTSSLRIVAIGLVLLALTAAVVSSRISGTAFSQSAAIDDNIVTSAEPRTATTPLNAITAFDSALISRHVIQIPPALIANQLIVANVTGTGQISSLDAAMVMNYILNTGNVTGATGTIFPPGLLMGDVSGAGPHFDGQPGTVAVSLPNINAGGVAVVPVTVGDVTGLGAVSFDFQVTFDPAILRPMSQPVNTTGTLTGDGTWSIFRNANNPGHLIISGFNVAGNSLTGSGTLINLRFDVIGSPGQSTSLTFEDYTDPGSRAHQSFLFNEGTPSTGTMTNGSVTLTAFTPSGTPTNTRTPTNTPTSTSTATATATGTPNTPTATVTPVYPFATVSLPDVSAVPGSTISVPVTISDMTGLGIISYDLQVSFNPAVLVPAATAYDSTGTLSSGMVFSADTSHPAHLILGADLPGGSPPLAGAGTLIYLNFNIVGTVGQATVLGFEDYIPGPGTIYRGFRFNNTNGGVPVPLPSGGTVTIAPNLTPTPTFTGTPLATPTAVVAPSPVIDGAVSYDNVLSPPFNRGVPNVTLSAAGTVPVGALTDSFGRYELADFGFGQFIVTPSKAANTDILGSITAFDSALIAQYVTSRIMLSPKQQFVADVSFNGRVTSFDAGMIADFVAGSPYPGPIGSTGTWLFSPSSRTYFFITSHFTGQDYNAYLKGEVSGNWNAAGPRPTTGRGGPVRSASVAAPGLVTETDKEFVVPVAVRGAANKDVIAYEFDLRYDPSVIEPLADAVDLAGTSSGGLSVVANAHEPGLLRVVVYGALPISADGVLLNLKFNAVGKPGAVSPLSFERILFNEGEPRVTTSDGRVLLF